MDSQAVADTISRLAALLEEQARASAKREERLEEQARVSAEREERLEQRMLAIAESASRASQSRTHSDNGGGAPTGEDDSSARSDARSDDSTAQPRPARRFGATATPAPRLVEGVSLREFATWREKFKGYALLTELSELPQESQTAALMALLDDQWARVLRHGLDVNVNTSSMEDIIDSMERHLRQQRSIILDRRDYYSRQQEDGESFDDFLIALKEIAQFCDFCSHCSDSQLRDKIVMGVRSEETLRVLLSEKDLTLQSAVDICRARENAQQNSAAMSGVIQPISTYRRNRTAGARRPAHRRDSPQRNGAADSCPNCGYSAHDDPQMCPARTATCHECGRRGHFQSVCPRNAVPEA